MNLTALYEVVMLALATTAISVTVSKAQIFASLREWVADRNEWLGELISCHYCTSHWVAMGFIATYHPLLVQKWIVADLLVSLFATVTISAVFSGIILKLTTMKGSARPQNNNADNYQDNNSNSA